MARAGVYCPWCGKRFQIEDADLAELVAERERVRAELGVLWTLAQEYVEAFRTDAKAAIRAERRIRILAEVAQLVRSLEFARDGKRYRVTLENVRDALRVVCDRQKTGFTGDHGYLKKVLLEHAKRVSSEGMTAAEEQAREDARRHEAAVRFTKADRNADMKEEDTRLTYREFLAKQKEANGDPTE